MENAAIIFKPLSVTIAPNDLAKAIKAVQPFVCRDATRANLQNILAEVGEGFLKLTATDGHTLCSVKVLCQPSETTKPVRLNPEAIEILLHETKARKYMSPCPAFEMVDCGGGEFPEYTRVMPARINAGQGDRVQGFDGEYLARIGHVQKTLKARNARVQFGDENTDPLRADIIEGAFEAVVIVMPVRV